MQKILLSIFFLWLIVCSCHTTKQVQTIVKDSAVSSSPAVTLKPIDSSAILQQQLTDKMNSPLDFTTFYARAKASYDAPDAAGNATVYIKIKKDSIIWISITGPLNVEGARVLITPDSIKIMNKLDHTVQLSSITHLQQITKLPFSFSDFQDVIMGKAALPNNNVLFNIGKDSITVLSGNDVIKYMFAFTKKHFLLGQGNYKTQGPGPSTSANIFYNGYQQINNTWFSTSRVISVSGANTASIEVNFKEYYFNQPLDYMFTILKNYTIKYE
ncbi:MAG: DUF4292 domain-containing protein [Bacteroidetes bacterium]|nr:DUF4292 domain-containing protein [Bacteroidota bacterium]